MAAVAAITAISNRLSVGAAALTRVYAVNSRAASVKSAKATAPTPATAAAVASTRADLPLSLLMSVAQPAAGDRTATTDYLDMRNAIAADNLGAAQQAYLRLQSDLEIYQPPAGAQLNTAA